MTKEVLTMAEIAYGPKLQGNSWPCLRCLPNGAPKVILAIVEIVPKQEDQESLVMVEIASSPKL